MTDLFQNTSKSSITVSWDVSVLAPKKVSSFQKIKGLCNRNNKNDDDDVEKQLKKPVPPAFNEQQQLPQDQNVPSRIASDGSTIIINNVLIGLFFLL